jgi:hypothetical protein
MAEWSKWRPFPDPLAEGILVAPIGPGVYELRNRKTDELVLVGESENVAWRMTSLLPPPLGKGTRKNADKRKYVGAHLGSLEYRTHAFATKDAAEEFEDELRETTTYIFPT